jgi:hypothetical protein
VTRIGKLTELALGLAAGGLGLALLAGAARAQDPAEPIPNLPPQTPNLDRKVTRVDETGIASYQLDAKLDDAAKSIKGKGTLTWTNASSAPTRELWFHLYLNAFKNDRTLFLRSPFGAGRSGEHATEWGYIDIERMTVRELGGIEIWSDADKHSPGDPDDQTDIRVPLPSDITPGQTVHIDFAWTSKLPRIVERTGYMGDFFLAGHWFPKIARRELDGTWAHFAFHAHAEFYADFGRYRVNLDVPKRMVVGATGVEESSRESGDRKLLSYSADDVHDFAFTAWPSFVDQRRKIDGIDVRLLSPPGHADTDRVTFESLAFAIPHFNAAYGRYPYPTLTVVHPPTEADDAGGMEYPMLITTGGEWYAPLIGSRRTEALTIHELGHQWFQGTIATNEPAWPFLDEGVNSYAESRALELLYGHGSLLDGFGLKLSQTAAQRAIAVLVGHDEKVAQPAAAFPSFFSLGGVVYSRTAAVLQTFERVYGEERFARALGNYARENRFKHPGPEVFLEAMNRELGESATQAMRTALFDKGWVDYLVETVDCVRADAPAGVFDKTSGRETVARDLERESWTCRALVRRRGSLELPVEVELGFADGHRERRTWDGHGTNVSLTSKGKSKMTFAIVDPETRVVIDENLGNNSTRTTGSSAGYRTLERVSYFANLALWAVGP